MSLYLRQMAKGKAEKKTTSTSLFKKQVNKSPSDIKSLSEGKMAVLDILYSSYLEEFLVLASRKFKAIKKDDLLDIWHDTLIMFYEQVRDKQLTHLTCDIKIYLFGSGYKLISERHKQGERIDLEEEFGIKSNMVTIETTNYLAEPQASYTYRAKEKVIDFMGINEKKFGSDLNDETFFIEIIRKGLPKKVIDNLMLRIGLTEEEMAIILHISKRTLQRRVPREALNEEQSERLIELAKVYSKGEDVLGNMETFKDWMNSNLLALGNKRPREFLDTSIGINILLDELGRIEHGVYA